MSPVCKLGEKVNRCAAAARRTPLRRQTSRLRILIADGIGIWDILIP
jgi:hypothetical protein